MDTIEYLSTLQGQGTSMVSITIINSVRALEDRISFLNVEYHTAGKIQCRI